MEYPKCLYSASGATMIVDNREEETAAAEMGWVTAHVYHKRSGPDPDQPEIPDTWSKQPEVEVVTGIAETKEEKPGSDEVPGEPEGEEGHKSHKKKGR